MIRQTLFAAAAIVTTCVSVAAIAETPEKVTFNPKTAEYCISDPAATGTRIAAQECHSAAVWAKQGVTFSTATQQLAAR